MFFLKNVFIYEVGALGIFLLGFLTSVEARTRHAAYNCTQETGTFPDPYSCESYWICQYGNALAASCNFGLIVSVEFSQRSQITPVPVSHPYKSVWFFEENFVFHSITVLAQINTLSA